MRFDLLEGEEVAVPSVADVLWLHDNVALIEGGMPGVLDEGALASALARPMHVAAYSDEDPDLVLLAAYLWHGVSEGHAFVDDARAHGFREAVRHRDEPFGDAGRRASDVGGGRKASEA